VLEPLGKWKKIGEPGHVILGGVDGDMRAARWMKEGYVDATGVQDMLVEADELVNALLEAISSGQKTPERWMEDPGFALTQANMAERANDMWGFKLLAEQGPAAGAK
jgi:ABC-type sugar transport system substrate-binding protein